MRRRLVPLVTTAASLALLATGCGVTDATVRPGVAVEVDGTSLSLATVDDALTAYCGLLAENEGVTAAPRALIRSQVAAAWAQGEAVEALAAELGVDVPADPVDDAEVDRMWEQLGEIDDERREGLTWLTRVRLVLSQPVADIGAAAALEETGEVVGGEPAYRLGLSLVAEWLEEREPEFNPVLGEIDLTDGSSSADDLSLPVSDAAVEGDELVGLTAEQVNALPAEQRCGPAAEEPGA